MQPSSPFSALKRGGGAEPTRERRGRERIRFAKKNESCCLPRGGTTSKKNRFKRALAAERRKDEGLKRARRWEATGYTGKAAHKEKKSVRSGAKRTDGWGTQRTEGFSI